MTENGNRKEEIRPTTEGATGYMRLDAWRHADDLAVRLFDVTRALPSDVRWLSSQMIRAAVSAPANIAEGYGRASNKEFLQHLAVAHGSLQEVDYYIHFMGRTRLIESSTCDDLKEQCRRTARIVFGLMKAVRSDTRDRNSQRRYLRESPKEYATDEHE
jgi:four helix bundle protein